MDPKNVRSLDQLVSLAIAAEQEAVRQYQALADQMRAAGNAEVAALFERLVEEERGHERQLDDWAAQAGVTPRPETQSIRWQHPAVRSDYDAEAVDPARSTAYKALSFAVHNEERAFHFYAYVAAHAEDPRMRRYAELLAREELGHAALLRSMRRQAWRAERATDQGPPRPDPRQIHNLDDLAEAAAQLEQALDSLQAAAGPDDARLRAAFDQSFEFYDAVLSQTDDEAVMLEAQRLTERMIDRMRAINP